MTRPGFPIAFAQGNTHRVVAYEPDRAPPAFERLENTLADGLRAARLALAVELPVEAYRVLDPTAKALRDHILDKRRLLSQQCRHDLGYYLILARRWATMHGTTPEIEAVVAGLEEALDASHRVSELLGAERDIGWHRGIGR